MFSALQVFLLVLATARCGKDKPVFSDDIQEIIDQVHNDCVGKTGVAEEDIRNCEKGIFKDDEKLKCYMVCLLEEASLVEDDNVDYDMLVSLMPEATQDRTRAMLYACKHLDVPSKQKCQRAFDVHKCSYEKDSDNEQQLNLECAELTRREIVLTITKLKDRNELFLKFKIKRGLLLQDDNTGSSSSGQVWQAPRQPVPPQLSFASSLHCPQQ